MCRLNVTDIFYSLQGECVSAGRPCVFLRLAGCNVHCNWCDSTYSWAKGKEMTVQEVFDILINTYKLYDVGYLCITGGEPVLQQEELILLMRTLRNDAQFNHRDLKVGIETNGTIVFSDQFFALCQRVNHWSVECVISPKLSNAGVDPEKVKLHQCWADTDSNYVAFKFVVGSKEDIEEVAQLVEEYGLSNIWLMPLCTTPEEHLKLLPNIWKECQERNWNLSPRLQVLIGGGRGV